jgi:hypothetical protein
VAADDSFNSLIVDDATTTNTSYVVTGLTEETTYYYRVRAVNRGGTSASSASRTVVTAQEFPPPAKPGNPDIPGVGQSGGNLSVNMSVGATAGADSYVMQIARDPDFTQGVVSSAPSGSPDISLSVPDDGNPYYARIVANNASGGTPSEPLGIITLEIPLGFSAFGAPLLVEDRRFAGDLGDVLADIVVGGSASGSSDKILLWRNSDWVTLWYNTTTNAWYNSSNQATDLSLRAGEGFFIERINRQGAPAIARPVLVGALGNDSAEPKVAEVVGGYNLLSLSEGKPLRLSTAFESTTDGSPYHQSLFNSDRVVVQNQQGQFITYTRTADGKWRNQLTGDTSGSLILQPGQAYYYLRQPDAGATGFQF